jgi:hypothetical protein
MNIVMEQDDAVGEETRALPCDQLFQSIAGE